MSDYKNTITTDSSQSKKAKTVTVNNSKIGFKNDIEEMMFGFGDKWPPNEETVSVVESLVVQYIENLCTEAANIGDVTGKLDKECFLFLVRKDRSKFKRVCNLLKANEELKSAQSIDLKEDLG